MTNKLLKTILFVATFAFITACGDSKQTNTNETDSLKKNSDTTKNITQEKLQKDTTKVTKPENKDFTASFVCPNRCKGSGSEVSGECPECGMELIKNVDKK